MAEQMVLFVHGISTRRESYLNTFNKVQKHIRERNSRVKVLPCFWGDAIGAPDTIEFKSIPQYFERGGGGDPNKLEDAIQLWTVLNDDPLVELKFALLDAAPSEIDFEAAGNREAFVEQVERCAEDPAVMEILSAYGAELLFLVAKDDVVKSAHFQPALKVREQHLGAFRFEVARAIVASCLILARQADRVDSGFLESPTLRDKLVDAVANAISSPTGSILNYLWEKLRNVGVNYAVGRANKSYGSAVDKFYRQLGDTLAYGTRGAMIRAQIAEAVKACQGEVIIFAHSLGGIASFELLVEWAHQEHALLACVRQFVSVGSQSGMLYELDALTAIRKGGALPQKFPPWTNIYDRGDFLSFLAQPVFESAIVKDHDLTSGLPFPQSHMGYFETEETYKLLNLT